MNLAARVVALVPRSVTRLTQLASVFALLGLTSFAIGLLVPKPLPVIFSMSIGHGLGALAVVTYFVAVALDATRGPLSRRSDLPPASRSSRISTGLSDPHDEPEPPAGPTLPSNQESFQKKNDT